MRYHEKLGKACGLRKGRWPLGPVPADFTGITRVILILRPIRDIR